METPKLDALLRALRDDGTILVEDLLEDRDMESVHEELSALKAEVAKQDLLFQSLTPGGSEYVGDPERCVAYAKDVIRSRYECIVTLAKRAKKAEAEIRRFEEENADLREDASIAVRTLNDLGISRASYKTDAEILRAKVAELQTRLTRCAAGPWNNNMSECIAFVNTEILIQAPWGISHAISIGGGAIRTRMGLFNLSKCEAWAQIHPYTPETEEESDD